MARPKRKPGRLESILSILLLAVLGGVAVAIVAKGVGGSLHPAVSRSMTAADFSQSVDDQPGGQSPLLAFKPESLEVLTGYETFDPQTLSDKINGKADTYTQAGFVQLQTQAFALAGDPSQFVQIYLFDMGKPDNAFSVYSQQKRSGAEELEFADNAYATPNSVFFAHGRWYGELVGASESDELREAMLALARAFVDDQQPTARKKTDARDLLPSEGLIEGSAALLPSDVFSYGELDRVWTAKYRVGDNDVTAFVSRRADAGEAARLAQGYAGMLREYGAAPAEGAKLDAPSAAVFDTGGTYEIVFAREAYLAGVHEAMDLDSALAVARRLDEALAKASDHDKTDADQDQPEAGQ
jgi:hypothetical protein